MELIKILPSIISSKGKSRKRGLFRCSHCSGEHEAYYWNGVRNKSCGCTSRVKTHGYTRGGIKPDPIYSVWGGIKQRCFCKNVPVYKHYGGRGITVCDEWRKSFLSFREWALSNGYKKGLEIDRINNDGDYEPNNCRFVTHTENMRNSSMSKLNMKKAKEIRTIYASGDKTKCELADMYGVTQANIWLVVNNKTWT